MSRAYLSELKAADFLYSSESFALFHGVFRCRVVQAELFGRLLNSELLINDESKQFIFFAFRDEPVDLSPIG